MRLFLAAAAILFASVAIASPVDSGTTTSRAFCVGPSGGIGYPCNRLSGPAGAPAVAACSFTRIDFTGGSLGAASLTRASSGTYVNVSGVLSTATTNTARFNYDANYPGGNANPSLTGPFLFVEPAATNLFLQSNTFSTTWFTTSATITNPGTITSPDNTADGWLFTSISFGSVEQDETLTAGQPYVMSGWDKLNGSAVQYFYQVTGVTISAVETSTSTWFRFSFVPTSAAGGAQTALNNINAATGTLSMFGFQLETAAASGYFATHPTSYIVTTTGTVTRSADVVTFTQPAGCGHNTYTFDDNSTQTVSQAAGSATVPTNMNRPNIKFIDGSS